MLSFYYERSQTLAQTVRVERRIRNAVLNFVCLCPYVGKDISPDDVISKKVGEVGKMIVIYKHSISSVVKPKHKYHYQVQGQLHITKRDFCLFVLWTTVGIKIHNKPG